MQSRDNAQLGPSGHPTYGLVFAPILDLPITFFQSIHEQSLMIAQDESINSELDIINCYASTRVSTPEYPVAGTSVSQVKPHDYPVTHVSSHLSSLKGESGIQTNPEPSTDNLLSYKENIKANTNPSLTLVDEMLSLSSINKVRDENGRDVSSDNSDMEGPDLPFIQTSSSEWQDRGAAKIVTTTTDENGVTRTTVVKKSIKDFIMGKTLGEGSYSTVILAKDKTTKKKYAMKVLDKRYIVNEKKVKYVNIEKNTLNRLSKHVGIIHLFYTFQDEQSLYFVLDYASNGELYTLIKKYGSMDLDSVRYYSAQILDAIKYIHDNGVIHRDIKPENILINEQMKIQITDFGTAKLLEKNENGEYPTNVRATSFVGTAEYVSPELLNEKYVGKACDIWAYGCLIYQMISGKPAFKATNDYLIFQKICKLNYAFTAGFPTIVRDLVKRIFVLKPTNRITIPEIQKHMFFESIDWSDQDTIWGRDPPELGPYKMSAQSMLPIPGLKTKVKPYLPSKAASSPNVKRVTSLVNSTSPVQPKVLSQSSSPVLMQAKNAPDQRSASSAAVAALSRGVPNNASTSRLQAPNFASSISSNKPDLIPGTNIPRPTVQRHSSKQLLASGAGSRKSSAGSLPPGKPEPVHPMTALDLKWSPYLKHHDERVLKADIVEVFEMTTEQVEKKYRGQLVDSPLGSNGRRSSGTSMLTQVVNGASGFRKQSTTNVNSGSSELNTENTVSDRAITYVEPDHSESGGSRDSIERSRGEADKDKDHKKSSVAERFMKAIHGNTSSQPVETRPMKHMLVITSFGQALLFEVSGAQPNPTYELRSTIDLVNLNVKFKEVMGETRKQKNAMITTGLFVIESTKYSFVFEVPKHEISIWTSTLLRSRVNEHDRKYWRDSMAAGNVGTSTGGEGALKAATQATNASTNHKELEPSLLAPMKPLSPISHSFDWDTAGRSNEKETSRKSQDGGGLASNDILLSPGQEIKNSSDGHAETQHTVAPGKSSKNRGERMMKTIETSHGRRKPPPPIPQSGHLNNGLPLRSRASNAAENAMVNAAINSIMNHPEPAPGPESSPKEGTVNKLVTGLNSRFLARSSRKR